ncbi:hypothetical protein ACSQ67_012676 [Phaseolus vulgaris]
MAELTTMADLGVFLNQSWGVGGGAMEDKDLDEDVWSVEKIPRANSNTPPSSDAPLLKGSSEPMDIPDWSKIYGKSCTKGSRDAGACNKGGDDEDDDMVPPHEWIARKLARSQISSFSVCEGMGRTLKGRDLSKVRNAILAKTGFIE